MKIVIIGTNGLLANELGLHFCNNGIELNSIGRRNPSVHECNEFVKIDLLNEQIDVNLILESDIIIYAAGAGVQSNLKESSESIYCLNTYVPINISNELNRNGYKGTFVTFGSCFEIGNNLEDIQFTEAEVVNSIREVPNDYCISKRLLNRFISNKKYSFKHLHLILPTIYGEKEASHRLIPYTIRSIKQKETMQFTSGKQIRQYLYAGDVPKIILELVLLEKDGIYNLSGEETYSVRSIIEEICNFYDYPIDENLFGKADRADVAMQNLQLNGNLIKKLLPSFKYKTFKEILKLYNQCY